MSDYLRRLAERAIGVAPSIKPRAPYRFEDGAKSLSDISHEPPDEAARTDEAERAPDTPARNPPTGRANTLRPPSRSSDRSPADVSALPHTTVVATTSGVPVSPVAGRMKSAPLTPPLPPAIEKMKQHAPDRPPRGNDASISSAATRDEGTTPLQIARTGSESRSPLPEMPAAIRTPGAPGASIRSERPSLPALVVRGSTTSRSEETRPIAHAKEVARKPEADRRDVRRALDELSSDRKSGGHQEPTVAVTIGRVEVRAVMEPPKAPTRTRRAAASSMSLDDYLKRHEERRR